VNASEFIVAAENNLIITGAAVGATLAILAGLRRLHLFLRRGDRFMTALMYEIHPNRGHSLRDAVDRIEKHTLDNSNRIKAVEDKVDGIGG